MTTLSLQPETSMAPVLNAADRCDKCGAKAWLRATMPSGFQLFFCAHHATQNLDALMLSGASILDERHFLNKDN